MEDKKPLSKLENLKTPEVGKIEPTKSKSMPKINKFDNSFKLEKEAKDVNKFDNSFKLEKEGKDPTPMPKIPKKIGKDPNPYDRGKVSKILENGGKNVPLMDKTLEKSTPNLNEFDTSSKLDNEAKDVSLPNPIPEKTSKDVPLMKETPLKSGKDVLRSKVTPEKKSIDINRLDETPKKNTAKILPFDTIGKLESLGKDVVKIDNNITVEDSRPVIDSKFNQQNIYEDDMNSKKDGNYPIIQSDLTNETTNPLIPNHYTDIGSINSNVTQAVDFLGGSNSYFGDISGEIPGFTQSPIFKQTIIGAVGNFTPNFSLSNLGNTEELENNKIENNETKLNNLLDIQFNPFTNDVPNYENIASNSEMTDFGFGEILTKLYDDYEIDPRRGKLGVLPYGQTDVKFPNPKNLYKGSKFDDPLKDGVAGGGNFNSVTSDSGKYSNVFRIINLPTLSQIVESGFGHTMAGNALQLYSETGGVLSDTNETFFNGPPYTPYTETDTIIGDTPLGSDSISLSSMWYYGVNPFPTTNNELVNSFSDGNQSRTVSINSEALTGQRLGFDDLRINTLYGENANIDQRLTYNYNNSGRRGEEPYVTINIPDPELNINDRIDSDLFQYNFGGQSGRVGVPFDRDKNRLNAFLDSEDGKKFLREQERLYTLNPRNARNFNKKALTDSNKKSQYTGHKETFGDSALEQAILGARVYSYTHTLYEKTYGLPFLLGTPSGIIGDVIDTLLLKNNNDFENDPGGKFIGGNIFQVTGLFNPMGLTIPTNVTPQHRGDLVSHNILNAASILMPMIGIGQTLAGGMFDFANPRALRYDEKDSSFSGLIDLINNLFGDDVSIDKPSGGKMTGGLNDSHGLYSEHSFGHISKANVSNAKENTGDVSRFAKLDKVELKPYRNLGLDGHVAPLRNLSKPEKYEDDIGKKIPPSLEGKHRINNFNTQYIKGLQDTGNLKTINQRGDFYTLLPVKSGDDLSSAYGADKPTEKVDKGYPFYFKDMRDDSYIFFRGFISGLIENITPEWTEQQYMGRAEGAWVYKKATRDINFNFDLFAQSRDELNMIYDKLEKLTSLCYPQYKADPVNFPLTPGTFGYPKTRMKPPLMKLRLGDLYGSDDKEVTGFMETLTYTFPDNNSWEHDVGSRVPKHVQAAVGFKVVHVESPNMLTKFYGKSLYHNIHSFDSMDDVALLSGTYGAPLVPPSPDEEG